MGPASFFDKVTKRHYFFVCFDDRMKQGIENALIPLEEIMMKNKSMLIVKVLLLLVLAFGIASVTVPADTVQAASANSKAKKALKKKIKNLYCKYGFADLDDDGISELITYQFGEDFDAEGFDQAQSLVIYKYESGKVKTMFEYAIHGPYFGPELRAVFYYRKGNPYVIINEGGDGFSYEAVYKADDASESLAETSWELDGDDSYYLGEESTTSKKYNAFIKSIKSGKKIKVKLKWATQKITNAYLKKMYKGVFDARCERGGYSDYDKAEIDIRYDDLTGDGLLEMIVNLGSECEVYYFDESVSGFYIHSMEYDWFMENTTMG